MIVGVDIVMDLDIVKSKKWLITLGLVGVSSYGAYKLYYMPSVVRKKRKMLTLLGAVVSLAEMVNDSAETMSVVTKDLKGFLLSDLDEIPSSIRQLSKISQSGEFVQSVSRVTEGMTIGVMRGGGYDKDGETEEVGKESFADKLIDRMMSSEGSGIVSVVVGSFARNLVMGLCSRGQSQDGSVGDCGHSGVSCVSSNSSRLPLWVDDEKCKLLVADCIQTFVKTAVGVYLDRTLDINFYDDMFSGMTNPKHQTEVRNTLVSISNGMVETLVKTSHQLLTSSKSKSKSNFGSCSILDDQGPSLEPAGDKESNHSSVNTTQSKDLQSSSFIRSISSTLAVPSNRRFVLNVTGRVTFETIKSAVEFIWLKIFECLKRSLNVVHEEVVDRGLQVIRYFGFKSSVVVTICFALFLYLLNSAQVQSHAQFDG